MLNSSNLSKAFVVRTDVGKSIRPMMRLDPLRNVADILTLHFSPDDAMLAIYGVGYPREMVSETFLWKFRNPNLCILEVGNYRRGTDSFKNQFVGFSSDSQLVLLREYLNEKNYTLRDTQYNNLIDSYYDARFVNVGNEIVLEYSEEKETPPQISTLQWGISETERPSVKAVIVDKQVQLVDFATNEILAVLEVSGSIEDATISYDGQWLALAITQPDKYAPYFREAFIELWDIGNLIVSTK